jgi:hypothetical protein
VEHAITLCHISFKVRCKGHVLENLTSDGKVATVSLVEHRQQCETAIAQIDKAGFASVTSSIFEDGFPQ